MRLMLFCLVLALCISTLAAAQEWEIGGTVGYGAYHDATIGSSILGQSIGAGFHPGWAVGVTGSENYKYIGGELRYLFRWGSPELQQQGMRATINGYTNVVVYDFVVHMTSSESTFRPYISGGAGIKVYTGSNAQYLDQPLQQFAILRPVTQVEPAISLGAGVKYLAARHLLFRADFHTFPTPLPNQIFRPGAFSVIHGWIFDFVPQLGASYTF